MDTLLYFLYTIIYLILLICVVRSPFSQNNWSLRSFIYLVLLGLVTDNSIIAVGRFIGEGMFLEYLNLSRYWIHALITPTLVLFSFGILKPFNLRIFQHKAAFMVTLLFTMLLIIFELFTETIPLHLKPLWEYDVLRYVPIESESGPPFMILFVTLCLLIVGIILSVRINWIWMLMGALLITLASVIPIPLNSSAITNGFELFLMLTLVLT
ncbi:hypothetical protein [Virgibacillus salexigens]|uniref:hypothetical protein n=1 Tax=Virgibacillus salexigens TaxID=61016 RepID=UPI00190B5F6C|nr:hypothetical protein [Virgibacillus salexigens]